MSADCHVLNDALSWLAYKGPRYPTDCCSKMAGIFCDSNGNIITIDLSNRNMTGVVPEGLTRLKSLTKLDLSNNKLSEMIPSTLNKIEKLEELNLSSNQLSGPVPEINTKTKCTILPQMDNTLCILNSNTGGTCYNDMSSSIRVCPASVPGSNDPSIFSLPFGSMFLGLLMIALYPLMAIAVIVATIIYKPFTRRQPAKAKEVDLEAGEQATVGADKSEIPSSLHSMSTVEKVDQASKTSHVEEEEEEEAASAGGDDDDVERKDHGESVTAPAVEAAAAAAVPVSALVDPLLQESEIPTPATTTAAAAL